MKTYNKTIIKVGGILEFKVERWTEHNHMTVYSDNEPIFDGDKCQGVKAIEKEIQRICDIAKQHGFEAEIIQ